MRSIFFLFFFSCAFVGHTQDLYTGARQSAAKYLFKISETQAQYLQTKDPSSLDDSFFQQLIDTFPQEQLDYILEYDRTLAIGHYLVAGIKGEQVHYTYFSNTPYDVKVLQNNSELIVQVLDEQKKNYGRAELRIGKRLLNYDKKSGTYRLKKKVRKENLAVRIDDHTTYFEIVNENLTTKNKKFSWRRILYGKPQRYLTLPIRFIVFLPIDGVKSIRRKGAVGSIYGTVNFARKIARFAKCLFTDTPCKERKYQGYTVVSKPKYKLRDTLKIKAFYQDRRGKALNVPLQISMRSNNKIHVLGTVEPYRPGAYDYRIALSDSLELKIDKIYSVYLRNRGRVIGQASFMLEQYELKNIHFTEKHDQKHFRGKPFFINLEARDENELPIFDARVKMKITSGTVSKFKKDSLFVPTILLDTLFDLRTDSITSFPISDAIFPDVDMKYRVELDLLNSENQKRGRNFNMRYLSEDAKVEFQLEGDSIVIQYFENDKEAVTKAKVFEEKAFLQELGVLQLPTKLKWDPGVSSYKVRVKEKDWNFAMRKYDSGLQVFTERTADSITVTVNNPNALGFSYFFYKVNKEIERGFGNSLILKRKAANTKNYIFSIEYLWGGSVVNKHYQIESSEKQLSLQVDYPTVIYPGQKTALSVQVLDHKEDPLPNVDVAAFGYTSKFKTHQAAIQPIYKKKKQKRVKNNYQLTAFEKTGHLNINFNYWNPLAGLNSMAYYNFLFPGSRIYRKAYPTTDSITQVAPFAVLDGKISPVHIVQIDSRPVYFSWASNPRPYSFKTSPGYHRIKLITNEHTIVLEEVYIEPNVKNILSVDLKQTSQNVKVKKNQGKLSTQEKRNFSRYNFTYLNNFDPLPVYLQQKDNFILLNNAQLKRQYQIAGPLLPRSADLMRTFDLDLSFVNEPGFSYEFLPRVMKLRELRRRNIFDNGLKGLPQRRILPAARDSVYTENTVEQIYNDYLRLLRKTEIRFTSRSTAAQENGSLFLDFNNESSGLEPLNILIFNLQGYADYDILPVNRKLINAIEKGSYRIVLLYEQGFYKSIDSLHIQSGGLNYYNLDPNPLLSPDVFSSEIDSILMTSAASRAKNISKKQAQKIYDSFRNKYSSDYDGEFIYGTVRDENGEALIGVTVVVPGTTVGTTTDFDGNYKILVPEGYSELEAHYVGYGKTIVDDIWSTYGAIDIKMEAGEVMLEEVVVSGYRPPLVERDNTTSASVVTSRTQNLSKVLLGKAAGLSISKDDRDILIRGSRSDATVYYIDGIRVSGNAMLEKVTEIAQLQVVTGEEAQSVYGEDKVILISTKGARAQAFYQANLANSSIRTNFSDEAFWEPKLLSDANGQLKFNVTFPDDITKWNLYFYAAKEKGLVGYQRLAIKSYKPIRSQLELPRFMLAGDSVNVVTKTLNYQSDTIAIKSTFSIDDQVQTENSFELAEAHIDKYLVSGTAGDTLYIEFKIEKEDGYFDGERKKLGVLPVGLEYAKGTFTALDKDTSFVLQKENLGPVTFFADANQLSVIRREIRSVREYKYLCNEQLASKLLALLSDKKIAKYLGEDFEQEEMIVDIIDKLIERRNPEGLWGWWRNNVTEHWIGNHALKALAAAKDAGYKVVFNTENVAERLVYYLESEMGILPKLNLLNALKSVDAPIDFERYLIAIDTIKEKNLFEALGILNFKSKVQDTLDISIIHEHMQRTLFGDIYIWDENKNERFYDLHRSKVRLTLLAYRTLSAADPIKHAETLRKMRNYLFAQRSNGFWRNTLESTRIIETILDDLLLESESDKITQPQLVLSGAIDSTIKEFPFKMTLQPTTDIGVAKSGTFPIYFTAYRKYWNPTPTRNENDLIINSYFDDQYKDSLEQTVGNEIKVRVALEVKKDADYIMVEVPIPAGCSYDKKSKGWRGEVHREYFEDKVVIFCRKLPASKYNFHIDLIGRYSGNYQINPAKASLMYFPTFYANTGMKRMKLSEEE